MGVLGGAGTLMSIRICQRNREEHQQRSPIKTGNNETKWPATQGPVGAWGSHLTTSPNNRGGNDGNLLMEHAQQ